MTDTKITINAGGSFAATYQNFVPGMFTVTAIRTFSSQQDGTLAFNYGVTDLEFASSVDGSVYTGNISSITSTISDHRYTLELSNLFGNLDNPTLVYDTAVNGNIRSLNEQEVYTDTMYFDQANVTETPLVFSFDSNSYPGPTNTVQLNFYTLLLDTSNEYQKSGDPTYFVV